MLTILVPVFEEKNNITKFINKILETLINIDFEILFVDDNSKDGSLEELDQICSKYPFINYIIRKSKERDLTESVKLGILNITNNFICVTDCDLQHDVKKIPIMYDIIIKKEFDLIIGSRFLNSKSIGLSFNRKLNSKLGILLSKMVGVHNISDPLSGFFLFNNNLLKQHITNIESKGFKILLSILAITNYKIKVCEIDTDFFYRKKGNSKLNFRIKVLFLKQLINIFFKKILKSGSGGGI